jgi:N-acetylmuramic acid 6-phosphate etherase
MLDSRITEQQNEKSMSIGAKSTRDILQIMNSEDKKVAHAVEKCIPIISKLVDTITENMKNGGRLFYVGAGTSGRLGVLDASECPPTFSTEPDLVQGIIAGGDDALKVSIEGAEDSKENGISDIKNYNLTEFDSVVGISASGTAPYVLGTLEFAKYHNSTTGLILCNVPSDNKFIDFIISAIVGPEILSGSTRLKSGTATKMILNMISTTTMVKLNKTYQNIMVDLKAVNQKLWDRGTRIIQHFTKKSYSQSKKILKTANGSVKIALVMYAKKCDFSVADDLLQHTNGNLYKILDK